MPVRRRRLSSGNSRVQNAAAAGFNSIRDYLAYMMQRNYQQQITKENAAYTRGLQNDALRLTDDLTRERTFDTMVSEGKADPEQGGLGAPPSIPRRVAGVIEPIDKADDATKLPTVQGLRANLEQQRVPTRAPFGLGAGMDNTETGDWATPEFNTVMGALKEKQGQLRAAEPPTTRTRIGPEGVKEEYEERYDPISGGYTLMSGTRRVERTGAEEGARQGAADVAKITTPGLTQATIDQQNAIERGTRGEKVTTAAQQTAATTQARLDIEMSPGQIQKRIGAATQQLAAELGVRQNFEAAQALRDSANAAGKLQKFLSDVYATARQLNDQTFGPAAKAQGVAQTVGDWFGMSPDLTKLRSLIAQNIRPLAVAMGAKEANVSDRDIDLVMEGVGLKQGLTRAQTNDAMRRLRDIAVLGPTVGARLGPNADTATRINALRQASDALKQREDEAKALGMLTFVDPTTGAVMDVIR